MTQAEPYLHPRWRFPWPGLVAPLIFILLTLFMFEDALFDSSKVIAAPSTDLFLQFLPWRKFGFDQLKQFNLALWNPHVYGGAPYFAGFQSALLYPPNWLHLFMPVGLAVSWINALHVFGAGMLMFAWCRYRGLSPGAGILAGSMFMFCGPYFPHVFAGHLPHVAIMIWAPLLFMSIDMEIDGHFARGALLGIFAMAMLLLAGHPQYVYYTGMAAAVYVLLNLIRLPPGIRASRAPIAETQLTAQEPVRSRATIDYASPHVARPGSWKLRCFALAGCALIVIGGVALTSIQLLAGIDFVSESVRSGGTKYEFSASFSFPPENLLTAIAPDVFGGLSMRPGQRPPEAYFGRCYLWEVCLYLSVTGLILAAYGLIGSSRQFKRGAGIMAIVCFILALGAHTPLHKLLYNILPGFGSFRGAVKFNYLVAMFVAMLAACGFDALLRNRRTPAALLGIGGTFLIFVVTLALAIGISARSGAGGFWAKSVRGALESATETGELFIDPKIMAEPDFFRRAGEIAARELRGGAIFVGAALLILVLARFRPALAHALIVLVIAEMLCYAGSTRATMSARPQLPAGWADAIKSAPEGARVLDVSGSLSNFGMWYGYNDVWGYDPGVLKRYAELVTFSQAGNPDNAMQYVMFNRADPKIFPLLRVAMVLQQDPKQPAIPMPAPMQLAQLVPYAIALRNRDHIFATMRSDSFDPRRIVLLDREPEIKPAGAANPGSVSVLGKSTDHIELVADVNASAILLVTQAYSKGWRVKAIGPTPQSKYEIMPANWAFQGIPLLPGKHHLRLEFRPASFVAGRAISILALLGYGAALVLHVRSARR